jgi:hypothetical protein
MQSARAGAARSACRYEEHNAVVDDVVIRFDSDLIGRLTGPSTFRLILQPAMAAFFAVRDGLRAAHERRPPYFSSLLTSGSSERRALLEEGWRTLAKLFTMAITIDIVYQVIVFRRVYPIESLVVAVILAFLPYLLLRGTVNRITRMRMRNKGRVPS